MKKLPMEGPDRKRARIALSIATGTLALGLGLLSAPVVGAVGLPAPAATTQSPPPSPYTSCMYPIPSPVPTPAPICKTVTPPPAPSESESPEPPPKKKPGKKTGEPAKKLMIAYRAKASLFVGELSATGKCEDLRRVLVYKVKDGKDERVGKDITDEGARYSVRLADAKGRYYAKAPQSVSIGYATQVDCERVKSPALAVVPKVE